MKMRELEQRTGAHREAIRVYFRNGLLPPAKRVRSNIAEYGEEHVQGILSIRRLLSERRLSIDEIKRALAGDEAAPTDAVTIRHLDELLAARLGADESLVPLESVKPRNANASIDAKALHKAGAIELFNRKGKYFLSRVDAQIVGIWGDMRGAGFTEAHGFTADLASIYVTRADDLAQAEIAAFMERVGDLPDEKKAEWAQAGLGFMMALFSMLRMKAAIKAIKANGL